MSSKKLHIHIGVNFFGAGNIGDDLMMAGFLQALGGRIEGVRITCCTAHDLTTQAMRFPSINWSYDSESNQAQAMNQCDLWLGLGGTPFQLRSGFWMRDHLKRQVAIARQHNKPMYYLGVGVEDESVFDDSDYREIANVAMHTWTRDNASANILRSRGVKSVSVGADLSHAFLSRLPQWDCEPTSELSLLLTSEHADFYNEVERALSQLSGNLTWLIQDVRNFPGSERAIFNTLPLDQQARMTIASPDYRSDVVYKLVNAWPRSRVSASSRYHGLCILGWQGAHLLAIERSGKIDAVARDFGIPLLPVRSLPANLNQARPVDRGLLQGFANSATSMIEEFWQVGSGHHAGIENTVQTKMKTLSLDLSDADVTNIAIVKHDSIGDFVLLSPFMRELRRLWPAAQTTLYVRAVVADLARLCPYADRVVVTDEVQETLSAYDLAIPVEGYDLVFVPRAAKDYFGGLSIASKIGGRQIWGFAETALDDACASVLTHEVAVSIAESHARTNLALLREFTDQKMDASLELWPRQRCVDRWQKRLCIPQNARPLCMIGFSAQHTSNVWSSENYLAVIKHLVRSDKLLPVLIAGPDAQDEAEMIASTLQDDSILNLAGFSLEDVCAIANLSSLYVGNDTGPKHIAAAAGVPVVEVNPFPRESSTFVEAGPLHFHPYGVPHRLLQPPAGTADELVKSGFAINLIKPAEVLEAVSSLQDSIRSTGRDWHDISGDAENYNRIREAFAKINVGRRLQIERLEKTESNRESPALKQNDSTKEVIDGLNIRLEECETDRQARLDVIDRQQKLIDGLNVRLEESETDRQARLDVINKQQKLIDGLNVRLEESETDRQARLDVINRQQKLIDDLNRRLEASEKDRKDNLNIVANQRQLLEKEKLAVTELNQLNEQLFDLISSSFWIRLGALLRLTKIRQASHTAHAKARRQKLP